MSWVVMTTQLTVAGGEYTVLIYYEDSLLVTTVDHTLGSTIIGGQWGRREVAGS